MNYPVRAGRNYGVYGRTASSSGYGVYASGRLGASRTKSFVIDHPDDPENKYLLHYAAESPEVINFYSGKVTLDAAGEACVELPDYFARINRDPRYTLTAVGAPMPMLHIAAEIDEAALSAGATPSRARPRRSVRSALPAVPPARRSHGRSRPSATTAGSSSAARPSRSRSRTWRRAPTSTPSFTASP